MTDSKAFVAWLDGQASVAKGQEDRHAGLLHGRPDGVPDIGCGPGSRRRGRLVPWRRTRHRPAEQPAPAGIEDQAQFLIAIASNDDQRSPNEKSVLKDTFEKAKLPTEIEVYSGAHGWCPPDSRVYNVA